MTTLTLKTATASDAAPVMDVVVLALSADLAVRWAYPELQYYLRPVPSFVRAFGGKAFTHESAYDVDGDAVAALWLPPDVHPGDDVLLTLLQRTVSGQVHKDVLAVFEQMGRYHPREPHWYLPLPSVDPPHQSQGYGSAFLQQALLPCDRDHKLASLESTNPTHISLYERHGFEVLCTMQVGTSPPIFPMRRKPRNETCLSGFTRSRRSDLTGQVLERWTVAALSTCALVASAVTA